MSLMSIAKDVFVSVLWCLVGWFLFIVCLVVGFLFVLLCFCFCFLIKGRQTNYRASNSKCLELFQLCLIGLDEHVTDLTEVP